MFSAHRPSPQTIDRFIRDSRELPLSYSPVGIVNSRTDGRSGDELVAPIGRGAADFARARAALSTWQQFAVGWVELFPQRRSMQVGTDVAILIRHFGFWSLNGSRVVYQLDDGGERHRFGYAYGTLTNHAESGEEIFEVFLDPPTDAVMYRIRAISWPQVTLTRVGQPIVRLLQARFRRDSAAAMTRAVERR